MIKRNNENYSPYLSAGTKSPKLFLLISVIAALCADLVVSAILIWSAVPVLYWIFPLLAMVADAAFLLAAIFTNFRFKYSVGVLSAFVAFVSAIVVAVNVINLAGETVTLSLAAAVMWTASHVLSVICVIATAVHASKTIKGGRISKLVAATLFCVLAAGCAALYGFYVLGGGFFGQGGYDLRALEYTYNETDDSFEVTGVMQGRGGIVVIPETFNDKKVSAVSCNVFNAEGITDVGFMTADVKFTDVDGIGYFGDGIDIHADKEDAEKLRETFFNMRGTSFKAYDLANCVVPDVDADEVYLTFVYDRESYEAVGGKVLPIWTAKKGETFDLSKLSADYPYVKYTTSSDEAGLYASYRNFDGKVLKELKYFDAENADGIISGFDPANTPIDGAKIKNSGKVTVKFEKVYRIKVQNDNDDKYEPAAAFKSCESTGYRFATAETFDGVLDEIKDSRKGFTLSYGYGSTATETRRQYRDFETSLSRIQTADNTFYIYPEWKLNAPTVTKFENNSANGRIVYGEDLKLNAEATAPAEGMNVEYSWSGDYVSQLSNFTITRIAIPNNQDPLKFNLTVTAYGDNTSLTSTATREVAITVSKRPVYITWANAQAETYDGQKHYVSFTVNPRGAGSGLLDDDNVSVAIYAQNNFPVDITGNSASYINAGTYTVGAKLSTNAAASNYEIAGAAQVDKVISKKLLTISWGKTEFVYDKTEKLPEYTVSGTVGADAHGVYLTGGTINSNAFMNNTYHTATAHTSNGNYYIADSNKDCRFTVAQREITVEWLTDTIGYTGDLMAPLAMVSASNDNSIPGDAIQLDRTGFERYTNAYTGIPKYTATATFGNRNYKATAETAANEFTIVAATVSFVWDSTSSFVYNGAVQYPKVTDFAGAGAEAAAKERNTLLNSVTYVGGGKDYDGGRLYNVTGTLNNLNYNVAEGSRTSGDFTITPAPLSVTFMEFTLQYCGTYVYPTPYVYGRVNGETSETVQVLYDGRGVDAGEHEIVPRVTNANYEITKVQGTGGYVSPTLSFKYTITPAPIVVEWGSAALKYNGKVHSPQPSTNSEIYRSDNLGLSCTYDKKEERRINNGEFTATATITNTNYDIVEGKTKTFGINPIWLEVAWSNTNLVYNGSAQSPVAEIKDKSLIIAGDDIQLVVTGSATLVGTYTATARINGETYAPGVNYRLYSETSTVTFYITAPQNAAAARIDMTADFGWFGKEACL